MEPVHETCGVGEETVFPGLRKRSATSASYTAPRRRQRNDPKPATATISALTRRPISRTVAMTGEITLRGRVLPVGGLKEKILAAHRAGIKTFVLPKRNEGDLGEVPATVMRDLRFVFAGDMADVLRVAISDDTRADRESR